MLVRDKFKVKGIQMRDKGIYEKKIYSFGTGSC